MSHPKITIEHGIKFPYDGNTPEPTDKPRVAALAVLADLLDRSGIQHELEATDEDVRCEIVNTLTEIIRTVMAS